MCFFTAPPHVHNVQVLIYCQLLSTVPQSSPHAAAHHELFVKLLSDCLTETLYMASMAELHCDIISTASSLVLKGCCSAQISNPDSIPDCALRHPLPLVLSTPLHVSYPFLCSVGIQRQGLLAARDCRQDALRSSAIPHRRGGGEAERAAEAAVQ
jgi:Middle or third domain of peptidase_M16